MIGAEIDFALGRRPVEDSHPEKIKAALAMRSQGIGVHKIAATVGLGVGTVLRLVSPASPKTSTLRA